MKLAMKCNKLYFNMEFLSLGDNNSFYFAFCLLLNMTTAETEIFQGMFDTTINIKLLSFMF